MAKFNYKKIWIPAARVKTIQEATTILHAAGAALATQAYELSRSSKV